MPRTALIVIDMVNSYDHPDADLLTRSVEQSLPAMQRLISRAQDEDVLTIYVNDNFGAWRSSRQELLETALDSRYGHLVEPIAPPEEALFVIKARHSIFFQTPLDYLLGQEDVDRVVLIGQVTESASSTRRSTPTSATSRWPSPATRSPTSTSTSRTRRSR